MKWKTPHRGWLAACALSLLLQATPALQWTTHKGPGFTVETPPGWSVFPDASKGWVHIMGNAGEDIVIWPVFLPGGPVSLDQRTAQLIHQRLASAGPYRADWEPAQAIGPNIVRARGKSGDKTTISAFAWKSTPRGVAGYFYLAGARETEFTRKSAGLARILASFRLSGVSGTGLDEFTQFMDPMEGAFTAEVPAGWRAGGGLFRAGPSDPHLALGVTSPDGQTKISLGDSQMSTYFMEPMPGLLPEGSMNGSVMILRYLTGAYFCQFYVSRMAPSYCTDLQITDMRDNPEMVQYALSMDPSLAQTPFSIGSVSFRCREQGQLKTGYCQALTTRPGGMWRVHSLRTYLTPPDRRERTESIMTRMSESIQFDPKWAMNEIRNAGVRSGIISGASKEIADRMRASQRYKDAVEDRIARMRSDATLGVVRLLDPATGRQTTVDSGANYYWVDPGGRIVGTEVDTLPGVNFQKMIELPVR
jgi:hypothetical protein